MKKKVVSLLLCAFLAASVCACGGQSNSGDSTNAGTGSGGAPEKSEESKAPAETSASGESAGEEDSLYPIVDEPITVTGLVVGRDVTSHNGNRLVWEAVEEVTGIHFEWIGIEWEALPSYLAAGEWPDFLHVNLDATYINDYGVIGGRFVDYNDYLDVMPNLVKMYEDYPNVKKASTEINGAIYRLRGVEVSATCAPTRAYYRTDLLEEYGLSVPKTVDELFDEMMIVKEKNGGKAPFAEVELKETEGWGNALYCAFGPSVNPDFEDDGTGKVIFNRTSDQYRHYLEYMNKIYENGLMPQEYKTMDLNMMLSLAQSGELVFLGAQANQMTPEDFSDGEVHLNIIPPMTSEYDDDGLLLGHPGVTNGGGFFINKDSKYVEELCKAFDIMYAEEEVVEGSGLYGEAFCYGPEGVSFQRNDDNTYDLIVPEGYDGSASKFQYAEAIFENAGRNDALAGYVTSTPGTNRARQIAMVENAIPYQCDAQWVFPTNYLHFTEEEQSTLDNKWVTIKNYYGEMTSKFITGMESIDEKWEEYCSTIESMGIADVLDVYQASYDRWNGK